MAFGFYLSSITVKIMNRATTWVTKSEGWLARNNQNRNHLEKFYWLLAILSLINFTIYLFVATKYKYRPQSHSILKQIHY
ncbi:putative proton-dependent oligopeptide transporter family, MFS transporter superfamily [Helianthus debilis subsp. tardiflorus]